ncbi:T9SS type A sorting domain-containing protein [Cruoricaptor ignavus]|uniref:T9SS type A sorting domain-containing protein n=1 Tax=Cruoricaptor ignavus TaxID=1118202 RepID=A0A7M1T6A9_9FLAO|nr:T9SS type A sorting domain-containing protein [Cruoricaptor ignavus]QOR74493.1 T9SS type A sorting domain-containing protein [Cruoricaptor ignavus]
MRKKILSVALVAAAFSAKAQFISYVGNNASFSIGKGALVYNGGGMKTVGSGKVVNRGNIMLVGDANSKLQTVATDGGEKTDGGNIIMKLNDATNFASSTYGQLYISGIPQANITAIVDKEYAATKNGTMQQMSIPFKGKTISSLATELGNTGGFSNVRNTNAIGYWENERVVMHNLPGTAKSNDNASKDNRASLYDNALRYYAIGTANWNPEKVNTVKGVPFSDVTEMKVGLTGAGAGIDFGANGAARNMYNERYNTYLQDNFETGTVYTGNFGKNIYQFGNPFLTNLNLSKLNPTTVSNIHGIRYEATGVTTTGRGSTKSSDFKYLMYEASGTAVGDTQDAYIKPMGTVVIKLKNANATPEINFNNLRRFAYAFTAGDAGVTSRNGNSVKQLRVIGLNSNGEEVARTYYVVSSNLVTGINTDLNNVQVVAFSENLYTIEETAEGNIRDDAEWLYINQANENDYQGKPILMMAKTDKIASYKFELEENAQKADNFSSGKKFYINQNGRTLAISNGLMVPAESEKATLSYGEVSAMLATANEAGNNGTIIVRDQFAGIYKVLFGADYKNAIIEIFDASGRIVRTFNNVKASGSYDLNTANLAEGVYTVKITSKDGLSHIQKIIIKN